MVKPYTSLYVRCVCPVNKADLHAWIILSLLEKTAGNFEISTCLNTVFQAFDLQYPNKQEQLTARREVLFACFGTAKPKSCQQLLTALKIGQNDGISVSELFAALITPNSYNTPLTVLAEYPDSFQLLLTALKIGQNDGISVSELFVILTTPNRYNNTPLAMLAQYPDSFQQLLTALKIGEPNGISIKQLLKVFTLKVIAEMNDSSRQQLFKVIMAQEPQSLAFLNSLDFKESITTQDLQQTFSRKNASNQTLLQQIQQDKSGKFRHLIWLVNTLFHDILPFSVIGSGVLKHNYLQVPKSDLTESQKTLSISRAELEQLLTVDYPQYRNKAWHNSFWKRFDQEGSTTIRQLKTLLTNHPEQQAFTLMEIRAQLHRRSIGAGKNSGTDCVLNALIEKFNYAYASRNPAATLPLR